MKMKKYYAGSMPEALKKVKEDLGSDAIILYSKPVKKGGFLQLFQKKMIEVVAASDPDGLDAQKEFTSRPAKRPQKIEMAMEKGGPVSVSPSPAPVAGHFTKSDYPPLIEEIHHSLLDTGFESGRLSKYIKFLVKEWYKRDESLTMADLLELLSKKMADDFGNIKTEDLAKNSGLMILVGPTGVGKTTTAAKLASKAVLDENRSVAFITADTYRIAAIDQLKTYAGILDVPVEVVYSAEDFKEALQKQKDKDLLIVDTAGRNYQQAHFVNELKSLLPKDVKADLCLVLGATAKRVDLDSVSDQFSRLPVTHYLFTKMDETVSCGAILNLLDKKPKTLTYITDGQNVPDDLKPAEPRNMVTRCIEGIKR